MCPDACCFLSPPYLGSPPLHTQQTERKRMMLNSKRASCAVSGHPAKPAVREGTIAQCSQEKTREPSFVSNPSYWTNALLKYLCIALSRITPQQEALSLWLTPSLFSVMSLTLFHFLIPQNVLYT